MEYMLANMILPHFKWCTLTSFEHVSTLEFDKRAMRLFAGVSHHLRDAILGQRPIIEVESYEFLYVVDQWSDQPWYFSIARGWRYPDYSDQSSSVRCLTTPKGLVRFEWDHLWFEGNPHKRKRGYAV